MNKDQKWHRLAFGCRTRKKKIEGLPSIPPLSERDVQMHLRGLHRGLWRSCRFPR